jgi:hypothetical protein
VSDPRARRSGPCGPPIPHRFRKQRRAGIKVPIKGLYSARRVKSPWTIPHRFRQGQVPIKGLYSSHYYLLAGWLFGLKSKDP